MKISMDFESRSECEIYECGAWAYSTHPSTEILCLAYKIDEEDTKLVTKIDLELGNYPVDLYEAIEKGALICAFNSFFESCIWANIMVIRFNAPRIPIKQFRCTMAKALARALPRNLLDCGKALNADPIKDEKGKKIMLKMCKPNSKGRWNEDEVDFEKLYEYCIDDVAAEIAVDKLLPDLNAFEQTIWFLDQLINQRGVHVDLEAIKKALQYIEVFTENLNETVWEQSGGDLDSVTRRMAVLDWCKEQGVDIESYGKTEVARVLTGDIPDQVRTILEAKLQLGKTSVRKYQAMARSADEDGIVRDLLIYHGASTGRWAGKLIQLHNLPKGNVENIDQAIEFLKKESLEDFKCFYPDVMGTLSSCIRGMIIAPPDQEFLIADYSAIEARIVLWLADDKFGLQQFTEYDQGKGEEPYVVMSKLIYNDGNISKARRQLGKAAVLGCGFGMGPDKFLATCIGWGIHIDETLAKKAVETYRSTYRRVQYSWREQENAAIACVSKQQDITCGKITWHLDGDVLLARLPSGRDLAYNNPSLEYIDTPWGERKLALHFWGLAKVKGQTTTKWVRQHTYGGKLVENLTQAVARDILAAAMLRVEVAGYSVAFSVHDEIVSQVPSPNDNLHLFETLVSKLPVWAQGCPIVAKGFKTKRYRKG